MLKSKRNKIITAQLLFMGLMLILSHCSLRHTIEINLNLEKSSVSNKVKVQKTNSNNHCYVNIENTSISKSSFQLNKDQDLTAIPSNKIAVIQNILTKIPSRKLNDKGFVNHPIPYYILYQNMRCFIS